MVLDEQGRVSCRELPVPEPGPGEVLVETRAAGICGTDLAIFGGTLPTPRPIVPGHELAGVVVGLGEGVDPAWTGRRVTTEINVGACGSCWFCSRGEPTQCPSRKALGIDVNGGFSEYFVTEARLLHELPRGTSFVEGTFVEPLAAAIQTFAFRPLTEEDRWVAVFGPGKLGLLVLQVVALEAPWAKKVVVGRGETKLNLARRLGADEVVNSSEEDAVARLAELTGGRGADAVVEATGNPAALNFAARCCRPRGTLYVKSTHGVETPVDVTGLVVREVQVSTSRCGPFPKALEALRAGNVATDPLVSGTHPLEDVGAALERAQRSDAVKVVFTQLRG
ncbi:MAG: alcohol dehydrogenase catalytic domain-containing protein [Promethearchaeota archaeon]